MDLRVYIFASLADAPVTGLTLTDFEVDIHRVNKSTQAQTQIVTNAALLKEIGEGYYYYEYANIDVTTYDYFATVSYTGADLLNTDLWYGPDESNEVAKYASLLGADVFASLGDNPVTGLALTDFDVDVYQVTKSDNHVTHLVTNADMTMEVGDGHYAYYLSGCDFVTNDYCVVVQYTGAEVLDSDLWYEIPTGDIPAEDSCSTSYRRELPRTLLPLDRWAQIVGIDPLDFRQVVVSGIRTKTSCAKVWKQYSWQESGQLGRHDVAEAIQQAEDQIAQYLGYKLLPVWEYAERVRSPQPDNAELKYYSTYSPDGYNLAVRAKWGQFVEAGVETKTSIEDDAAITYTDEDGDGYYETATVTVITTVTDEEEICVFYPCENGDDRWEIRPLRSVVISGGVATIKLWRHQLVQPDLVEAIVPEAVNGLDDANFLTTVDVYRRYNDATTQATLVWNPSSFNCGCCSSSSTCCAICGQTTQTGCVTAKDYDKSLLMYRAAEYDDDDEEWDAVCLECTRNPDQLILYYRAGLRDMAREWPTKQMSPQWERAVAFYALTLLDREICDCSNVKATAEKWREDLAMNLSNRTFQTTDDLLMSPFGTTRAGYLVWNMIREPGRVKAQAARW